MPKDNPFTESLEHILDIGTWEDATPGEPREVTLPDGRTVTVAPASEPTAEERAEGRRAAEAFSAHVRANPPKRIG